MKAYWRLVVLALLILVTDQITKLWIMNSLANGTYHIGSPVNPPIAIIDNFFYIVHIQNDGAAWGMFSGHGYILGLLGIIALTGIIYYRKALTLEVPLNQCAFGLMIGGILGNMIDRFRFNRVVDFLDFHLPLFGRYPSFNIADCGITIGVAIYILYSFILERKANLVEPET